MSHLTTRYVRLAYHDAVFVLQRAHYTDGLMSLRVSAAMKMRRGGIGFANFRCKTTVQTPISSPACLALQRGRSIVLP